MPVEHTRGRHRESHLKHWSAHFNLCFAELTVKHLSQGRAVQLWVAELDIFVCIPGDAPPQQRYRLWRTVVAVISQNEGV